MVYESETHIIRNDHTILLKQQHKHKSTIAMQNSWEYKSIWSMGVCCVVWWRRAKNFQIAFSNGIHSEKINETLCCYYDHKSHHPLSIIEDLQFALNFATFKFILIKPIYDYCVLYWQILFVHLNCLRCVIFENYGKNIYKLTFPSWSCHNEAQRIISMLQLK